MNTRYLFRFSRCLILFTILGAGTIRAQDLPAGMKSWWGTGLTVRVSPKTSFRVSQLSAFNTQPYRFQFTQANLMASRRIGDRWNVDVGYVRSWFKSKDEIKVYNRMMGELDFRLKWGKLSLKQSLRGEWHFPELRKYQFRIIYSNKLSYRFRKLPLRPTPYIQHQIYTYLSGRDVKYYDEETGELEDILPPNGIHRYRLTLGIRTRLAKRLYATPYWIWQREFNAPFLSPGDLNVPTRSGNSYQAPFNNYSLVGLSLSYTIKTY